MGKLEEVLKTPSFKFSANDFCSGAIIGLVCVTPAAGFIPHQVAPVFGIVGASVCPVVMRTELRTKTADIHNIFTMHANGELIGMFLTDFFARSDVSAMGGSSDFERNQGGWNGH